MKYGRSSERLEHTQLDLVGNPATVATAPAAEAGSGSAVAQPANVIDINRRRVRHANKHRPGLRELPAHLPRRTVVHSPAACGCEGCGKVLRQIGQDISEMLDYEPGSFHVVRHVRPKFACSGCGSITQASAPSRPIVRGLPGPGLLAHVMIGKYADHTPLYRQSQIYGREGIELDRSTLTDWVRQVASLLTPLADAVGRYALAAQKVHGDDTPIRVLGGKGKRARTGRLWVYVRDDRPSGDQSPPAVWFQYSVDRKGEHPARHLKHFSGILQADAFAGYNQLYDDGRIIEAACWSHARRKAWDIHERQHKLPGTLAHQALVRMAEIFKVEAQIRGQPPDERQRVRQLKIRPVLDELKIWMNDALAQVSAKSPMALAIGYTLSNWTALTRFIDDGRIESRNNAAERGLRCVALGRNKANSAFMRSGPSGTRKSARVARARCS